MLPAPECAIETFLWQCGMGLKRRPRAATDSFRYSLYIDNELERFDFKWNVFAELFRLLLKQTNVKPIQVSSTTLFWYTFIG